MRAFNFKPFPVRGDGHNLYRLAARSLILLLAGLASFVVVVAFPSQFRLLEEQLGAMGWVLSPSDAPEKRITVVAIDEKSISALGPWPWSREILSQLSETLDELGAGIQLYDVVFPEAKVADRAFADQLKASGSVIAQIPSFNADFTRVGHLQGSVASGCHPVLPVANGYIGNAPAFDGVARGHITPIIDQDGMIRKQPPLICVEGKAFPSMSLAAWLQRSSLHNGTPLQPLINPGKGLFDAPWRISLPGFGHSGIPLDSEGNMRLSYARPGSVFEVISVVDVLNKNVDAELVSGRWVLVGATAFGLGDVVPTPHSGAVPGVELQARLLAALLDGDVPYTPQGAMYLLGIEALVFAIIIIAASMAGNRTAMIALAALSLALPILSWSVHTQLLRVEIWLGWLPAALFGFSGAASLLLFEHSRMRTERQRVYTNFSSYMPLRAAQEIAFSLPSGAIEAERKEMVLLCADLRNFSSFEAGHAPEEAAALLHLFFVRAAEVVQRHGGLIEEFKGDSVLVSWEVDAKSNVTLKALDAAKNMLEVVTPLLPEELALGIAIEKGPVLVGSIGPAYRRSNAFLGDTVTLAIRMQEMTQELAQPVLIGEYAARELKGMGLESQGSYLLAGTTMPHILFALPPDDLEFSEDEMERPGLRLIAGGRHDHSAQ